MGRCGLVRDLVAVQLAGTLNPLCPAILHGKAVRGFVVFRAQPARPSFLPLSDSITNGINKLTHPVRCVYFSSQRNEHRWRGPEFFWKHDINIKTPTVTQSHALAPVSPTLFFSCWFAFDVQGRADTTSRGGRHVSPGSWLRVARLSFAL